MDVKQERLGRCYELAGRYASRVGGELVHGSIQGFGNPRIGHAWVLVTLDDGTLAVWEPATDELWEPQVFKAFFSAREHKRYTQEDVWRITLETEHWGPWEGGN